MRSALGFATAVFVTTAAWLFFELRSTWDSFNSFAVDSTGSSLQLTNKVEALVAAGEAELAIEVLRKHRAAYEFQLAELEGQLRSSSWRWNDQSHTVERAAQYLAHNADPDGHQ